MSGTFDRPVSSMPSPQTLYQEKIQNNDITFDQKQQDALAALEHLYHQLSEPDSHCASSKLGVYMWGSVGRGKTFLMDLFYSSLPKDMVLRLHFHHFMARLHNKLNLAFGQTDPLKSIAKQLAGECRVLCFDEFFVSDIGDAMLLSGLLDALFDEGVVMVATSNIAINDLFQKQLQKVRFEPAIALLQKNMTSIHLDGSKDHRYRHLSRSPIYFVDDPAPLEQLFEKQTQGTSVSSDPITVYRREIPVVKHTRSVVWFDFHVLCEGPRSTVDYIELAERFPTLMVSNIPQLSSQPYEQIKARGTEDVTEDAGTTGERQVSLGVNDDAVRRFISLVDECYDRAVIMYLHADVPLDSLYRQGALLFEFQRTQSRLVEMASEYYQRIRKTA